MKTLLARQVLGPSTRAGASLSQRVLLVSILKLDQLGPGHGDLATVDDLLQASVRSATDYVSAAFLRSVSHWCPSGFQPCPPFSAAAGRSADLDQFSTLAFDGFDLTTQARQLLPVPPRPWLRTPSGALRSRTGHAPLRRHGRKVTSAAPWLLASTRTCRAAKTCAKSTHLNWAPGHISAAYFSVSAFVCSDAAKRSRNNCPPTAARRAVVQHQPWFRQRERQVIPRLVAASAAPRSAPVPAAFAPPCTSATRRSAAPWPPPCPRQPRWRSIVVPLWPLTALLHRQLGHHLRDENTRKLLIPD